MAGVKVVLAMIIISLIGLGGKWVGAQVVHHVVGGDRGWDPSSDVASWSSGRVFKVGDKIWFTYSAAQESIVEVKSKEEYEACDVGSPIRMYTDGIDSISLVEQGLRYFVSSKSESCKNGLKLHVEVIPRQSPVQMIPEVASSEASAIALADGPTTPSASSHLGASFGLLFAWVLALLCGCLAH
ncbi:Cu_bind_like domain-containing protein [Cephalotus follicularis]|uniref:Cu_bind_like domain-containing protein n=1 Tax=Cephalotus follicularis TaxID=3775 RepID=A0A1Q3BBL7_CEPFO|nr:Cu_bind_like domain-containing protein [Cephalotus follicularis]